MTKIWIVIFGVAAAIFGLRVSAEAVVADQIATDKIKDLTTTMRVVSTNDAELKRIDGDFATTYRFKKMDIAYKNPGRVRLETKILGYAVLLVYNGDSKMVKVPFRKQVSSVAHQPGQKQSLMNYGIFAKDFLETDYEPVFLRAESGLDVYKLVQRGTDNRSHEIVWVNPRTAIIEKRESYNGDNILRLITRYKNPMQVKPGIWIPTRVEVYNQFGKLAGVQAFDDIKVNQSLPDSKFSVS